MADAGRTLGRIPNNNPELDCGETEEVGPFVGGIFLEMTKDLPNMEENFPEMGFEQKINYNKVRWTAGILNH